jgi:hypothetical protein
MKNIIADVTRAYAGSENYLLQTLLEAFPNEGERKLRIFCKDSQFGRIQSNFPQLEIKVFPETSGYWDILSAVKDLINDFDGQLTADNRLFILSYHGDVLKLGEEYSSNAFIQFMPWKGIKDIAYKEGRYVPYPLFVWPTTLISEDDAVKVLLKSLRINRATNSSRGIRQGDLRYFLAVEDKRFRKTHPHPGSKLPGLIKNLVQIAESRELISVNRTDEINPSIWLGREGKAALSTPEKLADKDKVKSRSQEFMDALRQKHLGPFSRYRQYFYDALEEVANATKLQPLALSTVLTRTIEKAREFCDDNGFDINDIPWREVRLFLINLMSKSPALLSENNQPLPPTFINFTAKISGLKEGWRKDFEGELIVALVEQFPDITVLDTPLISGALYLTRTEAKEEEVSNLIADLIRIKRLIDSAEYPYYLKIYSETEGT